ncbi:6,7-dimethyl-8-ribityllumazine synthase [Candidatus Peregrinibacteria bacterium]|nr:6,7-dimethyl-8-ribityllumazine synthase [Candidatus Peregrinibacteria bacterium]
MQTEAVKSNPPANPQWKIALIHSTYYKEEIDALVAGAMEVLTEAGIPRGNISPYPAAGSFEIPLIGGAVAKEKKADAMIGLGIIVEGETEHARLLAEQTARGIMDVQLHAGIPFAFEVLYVSSLKQALERCQGEGNKGREAARAVLHSLAELKRIRG